MAISGKVAKIEYGGGKVAQVGGWTVDVNSNIIDVTSFTTGDLQWRSKITGLSDWSGSIDVFQDASSTGLDDLRTNTLTPSTAQFIGYMDKSGGENLRGSVLIESLSVTADLDGTVGNAFTFQGTGALTYSTDT